MYRPNARQKKYRHGAELLNPSRKSGEIAIITNSTKEKLDANYQPIGAQAAPNGQEKVQVARVADRKSVV